MWHGASPLRGLRTCWQAPEWRTPTGVKMPDPRGQCHTCGLGRVPMCPSDTVPEWYSTRAVHTPNTPRWPEWLLNVVVWGHQEVTQLEGGEM